MHSSMHAIWRYLLKMEFNVRKESNKKYTEKNLFSYIFKRTNLMSEVLYLSLLQRKHTNKKIFYGNDP